MILTGLKYWSLNVLISLDQLLNTIFLGAPDETISSRAGKARARGDWWGCYLCLVLDWIDPRHCETSREDDEGSNAVLERLKRDKAHQGPFLMERPMSFNRSVFFREVRASFFSKGLSQSKVDGLNHLLDCWDANYSDYPTEFLAYCLATAYHETAHTFEPLREYGRGRGRRYGRPDPETGETYYGRGYVQLTWKYNYKKAGNKLGCNFVDNPDAVMRPDWAARILFTGCIEGWFTGKKLQHYINPKKSDYRQARRIVNGMDRASKIAGYARKFEHALDAATSEQIVTEKQLEQAGSRTIKNATGNKDAGGAVIGVGVLGVFAKILEYVKGLGEALGDWAGSIDTISNALTQLLTLWPVALLVCGGIVIWRNREIIKARISDEPLIGRLENATPD